MTLEGDEVAGMTGTWPRGTLPDNIQLADDCFIENKQAFGHFRSEQNPGLIIGPGVRIFTWTAFNVEPTGMIEVGEGSTIVGATFMCAKRISVGKNVVISYDVTIADSDFHPLDPEARIRDAVANAPHGDRSQRPPFVAEAVEIGDGAQIGIGAIVLKGVRIGRDARVAPGSVVTRDVPAGAVVEGNPARAIDRP